MFRLTIILFLSLFGSISAQACSCIRTADYSELEEFNSTDLVFLGKVIAIDTVLVPDSTFGESNDEIWYTFEVEFLYRGKKKLKSVKVRSGIASWDDCKYVFKLDEQYVVYANHPLRKKNRKDKSVFETNVCTNTDEADDVLILDTFGLSKK